MQKVGALMMKLNKTNFLFFILHIYVQYLQDLCNELNSAKNMQDMRDVQYSIAYYRPEVRSLLELRAKKKWTKMACRNFLKFCKKQPPNCKMKSCSQCCSVKENKNIFLRSLRRDYQYLPK
jgi:neutral trehalase